MLWPYRTMGSPLLSRAARAVFSPPGRLYSPSYSFTFTCIPVTARLYFYNQDCISTGLYYCSKPVLVCLPVTVLNIICRQMASVFWWERFSRPLHKCWLNGRTRLLQNYKLDGKGRHVPSYRKAASNRNFLTQSCLSYFPGRAASVVGIPKICRYTDFFKKSVFSKMG